MKAEEALFKIKNIIEGYCDERIRHSFYLEFRRRLLVLQIVQEHCRKGGVVVDLGASPFIINCSLKHMGYKVIVVDHNPAEYATLASQCSVEVIKADL